MGLFTTLDAIFAPLIVHPAFFVLLISLVITIFVTVLNLVLIKKEVRDRIKTQMKYYQEEMKKAQKDKNMKKMQELQKGQMEIQLLHMKETLKISAVSILLLWLMFAWMQHVYVPNTTVDGNGTAVLSYEGQNHTVSILNANNTRYLIADGKSFELPEKGFIIKDYQNNDVDLYGHTWKVELSKSNALKFNRVMAHIPFFGNVGLIGWYILTALTFGVIFRKLFDLA